ncbi:MAG: UDP-N-acetylglucosamine 1-carboxyvinyltransferase [Oscillospiraceae bacterium]
MGEFIITGGNKISSSMKMHGAKNSILPILAGTLLNKQSVLHNCPNLSDVRSACDILEYLGAKINRQDDTITVDCDNICSVDIPDTLMREMRSSIIFLGAVLARFKKARITMPGGCELGARPIDIHLSSLEKLGVVIEDDHGYLNCYIPDKLVGADITLQFPSVGATENIMIAASTAQGRTIIRNAAREPEINDLADFLNKAGAKIALISDGTIIIDGVQDLHNVEHTIIPDRIATATYLCCAAVTGGEIEIQDCDPRHIFAILPVFDEAGCKYKINKNAIYLSAPSILKPFKLIRTMPYPGFPTDAGSPLISMASIANGTSMFVENIFENRYKYVNELMRMGANVKVEGRTAVIQGVKKLHSATVECTDLRGGAALVVAGLCADGVTVVRKTHHIERGYQDMEKILSALGANIVKK